MKNLIKPLGISSVLEQILNEGIKPELKGAVNNFLLPLLDAILLVVLIVTIINACRHYKKQEEVDYITPIVIGVCLAISLTASVYMWAIIGW